ncbi:hypothetical protein SAMD00019534_107930 [Acytostelium subglobosum LB1]|uniref:hypothetical protein n=1 Tax=Acytostelium subglobosum LB1 TaxID=1410327 RepID=UPI000645158A|nr:hypothetical protein SAMD00019534_107930 [Acytostelium subglobosum LB1]GAM27617.1 hypothetical protein SAMD00019534_107930 [Acytostelium subglobosum LB1]|eukprot:XP_012749276.1 hypothetical protein SAMD00019534_107930 [Acytostelium subglobosum LB1]
MGQLLCYPVDKAYNINGKKYICSRLLAEGGFSFVYLVKDASGRRYALKSMLCQTAESEQVANREIQVFNKFNHPNILRLIDHSVCKSHKVQGAKEYNMLMPFYKDGSLQDVLDRQRTVNGKDYTISIYNEHQLLTTFRQILDAIAQFHHCDPPLAHRDIKPGNVLLSDEKKPVLMDFGSTTQARIRVTSRKQALEVQEEADQHSTPLYKAPELFDVASDCNLDERTDIWALGCLLYAMSFNRSPFESSMDNNSGSVALSVLSGRVDIPASHSFSNELIQLIRSMLSLNPQERPFIDNVIQQVDAML